MYVFVFDVPQSDDASRLPRVLSICNIHISMDMCMYVFDLMYVFVREIPHSDDVIRLPSRCVMYIYNIYS